MLVAVSTVFVVLVAVVVVRLLPLLVVLVVVHASIGVSVVAEKVEEVFVMLEAELAS